MSYTILRSEDLVRDGVGWEWEGFQHANICVIRVDMAPGGHVRLHKHPYKEIFIVQEGTATYRVGDRTLEAHAGQIIVVEADMPHGFTNTGTAQLRQLDIHLNKEFITDWLE